MKKVLLLGDSIRLGYQPLVKEKLANVAEVFGPEDNCRFAKYTLWYVNIWIQQFGKPDVIHWNNGLWHTYLHNEDIGIFTPLTQYLDELRKIHTELKKTGAVIIWATTTPVSPMHAYIKNCDIDLYNDAACKLMHELKVEINDLNKLLRDNKELYICEDHIHLSDPGKEICARAVSEHIKKHL